MLSIRVWVISTSPPAPRAMPTRPSIGTLARSASSALSATMLAPVSIMKRIGTPFTCAVT